MSFSLSNNALCLSYIYYCLNYITFAFTLTFMYHKILTVNYIEIARLMIAFKNLKI